MKIRLSLLTLGLISSAAVAQQVPFPSTAPTLPSASGTIRSYNNTDVLPYYTLVNGRWVQAQVQDGCSATPVTIYKKHYRSETWNNHFRGGSASSLSSADSGQTSASGYGRASATTSSPYDYANARAAAGSAQSSRWNSRSSEYASDWHNNRLTGQIIDDDIDSMTFYPCARNPQQ